MKNHPISVLKKHLDQLDIEYEYDKDDQSLEISFAEKERESIHMIDYKSIEIEYNKDSDKFGISMYTSFNIHDYHELPPSTVMRFMWPADSIYSKMLAITLKYYIKTAEADLMLIDEIQSINTKGK